MHTITFYPVGNGDTCQIVLDNGKRILLDFRQHCNGEDPKDPHINLNKRLREELSDANRDNFDVVAFTHADNDHICGSTDFFELLHAEKYQGNGRIKIDELWVPAALLLEEATNEEQSEEFVIWRQEARHRLRHDKGIKVFSKPQGVVDLLKDWNLGEFSRDHRFIDAGTLVPTFSLADDGVEFFCHSPFVEHCNDGSGRIRNLASLIFNVRFSLAVGRYDFLAIGDSEWEALSDIVKKTKKHGNEDRLEWDLYNIPHHCSYLALGPEKGERMTIPDEHIRELLLKGKASSAYIVSSSKPIPDSREAYDQTQPPHIQARNAYQAYLEEAEGRKLLVTMEEPNGFRPEPIVFEVSSWGGAWKKAVGSAAAVVTSMSPPRAG